MRPARREHGGSHRRLLSSDVALLEDLSGSTTVHHPYMNSEARVVEVVVAQYTNCRLKIERTICSCFCFSILSISEYKDGRAASVRDLQHSNALWVIVVLGTGFPQPGIPQGRRYELDFDCQSMTLCEFFSGEISLR